MYTCWQCGTAVPRDMIGRLHSLTAGQHDFLVPGRRGPKAVVWMHPSKYAGHQPASTCGHHGNSSGPPREAQQL